MQNLPISAAPPVSATQPVSPTDNGSAAQAAEPFGVVLARHRASSAGQESQSPDSKASASTAANDAPVNDSGNSIAPATAPDMSAALSGDVLAAMLPAVSSNLPANDLSAATADVSINVLASDKMAIKLSATGNSPGTSNKNKTDLQSTAPDPVSTLPGDMLAMLLPSNANTSVSLTATAKAGASTISIAHPDSLTNGSQPISSQLIGTAALGATMQSGKDKATWETTANPGASSSLSALPGTTPGTTGIINASNTGKDTGFAAVLDAAGKDGAKASQPDTVATKISAQAVAPSAPDGLMQSGTAPTAPIHSENTLAVQPVINTPVTDKTWGNEFSQKITWMASQHEQTAELHLNPPNLGPLDVVLKVSGDQATALFTSPHAAVRDVVQQALPQLREMLAGNGITLGNAMVSDQSPKDQQAWQASQQQKGNSGSVRISDATVTVGDISSLPSVSQPVRYLGMVDTFA